LVRFGLYRSRRIGSMVGDLDVTLSQLETGLNHKAFYTINIFIAETSRAGSANQFVTKLWKRSRVKIIFSRNALSFFQELNIRALNNPELSLFLIAGARSRNTRLIDDRDRMNSTDGLDPQIYLSAKEINYGLKWLEKLGINRDSKIALLIGRDDIYGTTRNDNPNFHSHRNANINTFDLAATELVKNGYFVFRMGSMVKEKFLISDEKSIFDYAFNGMRSEFLDVFLAYQCTLCVSVSTGYDAIPLAFRKPIVYVNYPVLGTAPLHRRNALVLCKVIKDKDSKRILTISELVDRKLFFEFDARLFESANCIFEDNSNVEILYTVIEGLKFIKHELVLTNQESFYQSSLFQQVARAYSDAPEDLKCELNARYATSGLLSGHYGILKAAPADVTQVEG
jgi:putative glycosyltransferase (TIGR04372 family)